MVPQKNGRLADDVVAVICNFFFFCGAVLYCGAVLFQRWTLHTTQACSKHCMYTIRTKLGGRELNNWIEVFISASSRTLPVCLYKQSTAVL
ncbi:hypothetical protein GDO81_008236 [Engystomops pustulosus]|uniref:Secreted protein n=1 Tax=Engystomops pustulosus TaxID=76066 RepID=A0AAV7CEW1_ENGPU|nr:hypothetical protein GDO81_008236 [Engystomops pustulosus]